MPFLVDGGPPVSPTTLQAARNELPREYGVRVVNEMGRKSVLVRVPRPKPDYNYELAMCAFYASLEDVKDAKDVLLIGDEKTVRMEPLRLRDHIREQTREDKDAATQLRAKLPREHGWTIHTSPNNNHHKALALRLPAASVGAVDEATLLRARAAVGSQLVEVLRDVQFVYLVADNDYARIGRRVFVDAVASDLTDAVQPREGKTANPLHLAYQTPGAFIKKDDLPRG